MVTTPDGISTYQRYMARAWDERDIIGVPTGFQSLFGRPETGSQTIYSDDAEVVDIDVIRGNERIAALVPRGGIQRSLGSLQEALNEQKFSNQSRVYPLSIELFDIDSGQLNKRLAGEQLYAPWSRERRLRTLAIKALKETTRRSVRMFEVLASQMARTGKQDAIIGTSDADLQYDLRRNAGNTITVGTKWNAASPTILDDIDSGCDVVRQNGHMRADVLVLGASAMAAALNDTDFQTIADNRRIGLIRVSPDNPVPSKLQFMVSSGFDARGMIMTPKGRMLWLFTYDEGYTNSSGTYTPYMPLDEGLIFSSDARCDRYFGPPETLPMDSRMRAFYMDRFGMGPDALPTIKMKSAPSVVEARMFHFDAYPNMSNTTVTHRTQSAPIYATTHVDCFALLDGLV